MKWLLCLMAIFAFTASAADISGNWKGTAETDRKSTRLNSSHLVISYAVFCLKKNKFYRSQHFLRAFPFTSIGRCGTGFLSVVSIRSLFCLDTLYFNVFFFF